jgi:hypothetical protein
MSVEKYNFDNLAKFLASDKFLQKNTKVDFQDTLGYGTLTTLFDLYSNGFINNSSLGFTDEIKLSYILNKACTKDSKSIEILLFNVFQSHSSIKRKTINEDFNQNYGVKHLLRDYLNGDLETIDSVFKPVYKVDLYGNVTNTGKKLIIGNLTDNQKEVFMAIITENCSKENVISYLIKLKKNDHNKYNKLVDAYFNLDN